jgi:hypothetical protein
MSADSGHSSGFVSRGLALELLNRQRPRTPAEWQRTFADMSADSRTSCPHSTREWEKPGGGLFSWRQARFLARRTAQRQRRLSW